MFCVDIPPFFVCSGVVKVLLYMASFRVTQPLAVAFGRIMSSDRSASWVPYIPVIDTLIEMKKQRH